MSKAKLMPAKGQLWVSKPRAGELTKTIYIVSTLREYGVLKSVWVHTAGVLREKRVLKERTLRADYTYLRDVRALEERVVYVSKDALFAVEETVVGNSAETDRFQYKVVSLSVRKNYGVFESKSAAVAAAENDSHAC
jgi:hypothetical protein